MKKAAKPPSPLRAATICGNDVILTFNAQIMPTMLPKLIIVRTFQYDEMFNVIKDAVRANEMPKIAS